MLLIHSNLEYGHKTFFIITKKLLSYERKEEHYSEWCTASREAYSKQAELTSGLSVGMSLPIYVCL